MQFAPPPAAGRNDAPGPPRAQLLRSLIVGGALAGLWCGSLDAVLATVANPTGYPSVPSFFLTFLVLAGIAAAAHVLLALAGLLFLPGSLRDDAGAYSVSLGTFLVSFFALSWIAGLNAISAIRENLSSSVVQLGMVLLLSLLAGAGSRALVARFPASPRRDRRIALAALLFAGGLSATAFAATLVHVTNDDVGVVKSSPPGPRSLPDEAPIRRVVLLTVDTLRKDTVTTYNPDGVGTPHIDSLAKDSIVFDNAFSSAPWTVPAIVSIFTGLPPDVHGINYNFPALPPKFKTLAEHMATAGYQTAAIGSQPQLLRIGRGFDTYQLGPDPPQVHDQTTAGRLLSRLARQEWTTEVFTNLAIRWLHEHQSDDFFLWLHWLEPHVPYEPPQGYLPESPLVQEMGRSFNEVSSVHVGRAIRTPRERQWLRALYDAEVRYTDDAVGRVLDQLQRLGIYDDSLIIFTTDHGEAFWDHGHFEHGHSLYDELVAAPLFIKPSGAAKPERIETPVSTAALFSTILDLCEIDLPEDPLIVGSLKPGWTGGGRAGESVYVGAVEYFEPRQGVVFDNFKYIVGMASGREELFDLNEDPAEEESLVQSHISELERGRAILRRRARLSPPGETEPDSGKGDGLSEDVEKQLRALGYIE